MAASAPLTPYQQLAGLVQHWPDELRGLRHYLPYRQVPRRGGGVGKAPCRWAGRRLYPVSAADPRYRLTFGEALELLQGAHCDGIGLALDEAQPVVGDWPLVGVDLDGVVGADGITPAAHEVLETLGPTYTELSPSGTGIHAYALGRLPPLGRRGAGLELIPAGYLTITGHVLPGSVPTVEPCQPGLLALHARVTPPLSVQATSPRLRRGRSATATLVLDDAAVLRRARQGRRGALFIRLYDSGSLSHYGSDHSRADLALLRLLARHTTDPAQLERLFAGSALYRPHRWSQRITRNAQTYGERTLATALQPFPPQRRRPQ